MRQIGNRKKTNPVTCTSIIKMQKEAKGTVAQLFCLSLSEKMAENFKCKDEKIAKLMHKNITRKNTSQQMKTAI